MEKPDEQVKEEAPKVDPAPKKVELKPESVVEEVEQEPEVEKPVETPKPKKIIKGVRERVEPVLKPKPEKPPKPEKVERPKPEPRPEKEKKPKAEKKGGSKKAAKKESHGPVKVLLNGLGNVMGAMACIPAVTVMAVAGATACAAFKVLNPR